jgi:hypothetical protein
MTMYSARLTLPFAIDIYQNGNAQAIGLLNLTPHALLFEYQIEKLYNRGRDEVQRLELSLAEVAQIELKDRWFWATLTLQTRSIGALEMLPQSRQGRISLSISRGNRSIAKRFVRILNQYFAEHDLAQLEAELQRDE